MDDNVCRAEYLELYLMILSAIFCLLSSAQVGKTPQCDGVVLSWDILSRSDDPVVHAIVADIWGSPSCTDTEEAEEGMDHRIQMPKDDGTAADGSVVWSYDCLEERSLIGDKPSADGSFKLFHIAIYQLNKTSSSEEPSSPSPAAFTAFQPPDR